MLPKTLLVSGSRELGPGLVNKGLVEAMEIVHQRRLICMPLIQSQNLSPYRVKTNGETFAVGRINSPSMVGSMYTTQKTETR